VRHRDHLTDVPVHAVVLLVYLIIFYVAVLFRSRLNLSLLDDLPYILAAFVVGFAIELALISLCSHVDRPARSVTMVPPGARWIGTAGPCGR
jgi:hypothetical protein